MRIIESDLSDLPAILALQYLAYQSEAELLGNWDIPPLRQTLTDLESEIRQGPLLKAENDAGEIVGSIRGRVEGQTLFIGKLMVHPRWRRRGLGGRLLITLENLNPGRRYELFTSSQSLENLKLYQGLGYTCFKESALSGNLRLVYLEKNNPNAGEATAGL